MRRWWWWWQWWAKLDVGSSQRQRLIAAISHPVGADSDGFQGTLLTQGHFRWKTSLKYLLCSPIHVLQWLLSSPKEVFIILYLFACLLAGLCKYCLTDFHKISWMGGALVKEWDAKQIVDPRIISILLSEIADFFFFLFLAVTIAWQNTL